MYNYINNLNSESLIILAKQYCNINFSKNEVEPILPYLKKIYLDFYKNKDKREYYKNELKNMTNEETYNKIILLLNKFNLK